MRNRVVHDYFEIDLDIVWSTIQQDLPKLAEQIRSIPVSAISKAAPHCLHRPSVRLGG